MVKKGVKGKEKPVENFLEDEKKLLVTWKNAVMNARSDKDAAEIDKKFEAQLRKLEEKYDRVLK